MATNYGSVPQPITPGYGGQSSQVTDFASGPQGGVFHEDFDASQRGSSLIDGPGIGRSPSGASTAVGGVSRNNTLKKKSSVRRMSSLRSRKSGAGSIKGVKYSDEDYNSAFFTPVPTSGSPTEILANRFQAWRQLLKTLITYFREIQNSYEARAKAIHKVQNTISNISLPTVFLSRDGLGEATRILEDYHKHSIAEANKSRDIENDVIGALSGLRSDLGQKIKEIKSLSGDFKNSVEKEKEGTRREVEKLQDALQHSSHEDAQGKNDPYVVKLGVERAIEKQLDEENYLHRAYLNLESSGRELEAIVVGEIQKAYNALAGILKREGDDAYAAVEGLRTGPIAMPKDQEWQHFVTSDPHFVDPELPLRRFENIEYPGKNNPQVAEIRAGMLERKSKYLKSYTPGWYVLSATHLHEFKSADKIYSQPPVMSLYLLDQKLGSHSERGSSSHKFMLKGKQAGSMHKGHNWVFRAESYETMMAWFEDIRILTEKTGEERNAFVRKHARSVSGTSERGTVSSDGLEDDEADKAPYSAAASSLSPPEPKPVRPQPGGRFPSDLAVRTVGIINATDGADSDDEPVAVVPNSALSGPAHQEYGDKDPYRLEGVRTSLESAAPYGGPSAYVQNLQRENIPIHRATTAEMAPSTANEPMPHPNIASGDWEMPAAVGAAAGAGAGVLGTEAYKHHQDDNAAGNHPIQTTTNATSAIPAIPTGGSSQSTQPPTSASKLPDSTPALLEDHDATAPAQPFAAAAADQIGNSHDADASSKQEDFPLGGNEKEGAHLTGQLFPKVIRHDTEMSVGKLHVPGEFK